jgi:hypothetical protein
MFFRLFRNKIIASISGYVILDVCVNFALLHIYTKPPQVLTTAEVRWTRASQESYQLATGNDYFGFARYIVITSLPGAIGCGLALSCVDLFYSRKK